MAREMGAGRKSGPLPMTGTRLRRGEDGVCGIVTRLTEDDHWVVRWDDQQWASYITEADIREYEIVEL